MSFNQSVQYSYDELNRLTAVIYGGGQKITYTYDGAGNPTSVAVGLSSRPWPAAPAVVSAERLCPNPLCQRVVKPGKNFCAACGTRLPAGGAHAVAEAQAERHCPRCNQAVPPGKKFCTRDGTPVP